MLLQNLIFDEVFGMSLIQFQNLFSQKTIRNPVKTFWQMIWASEMSLQNRCSKEFNFLQDRIQPDIYQSDHDCYME